jgi:uncharacterized membrane protein YgaE (UPF0421/DUF939 family)
VKQISKGGALMNIKAKIEKTGSLLTSIGVTLPIFKTALAAGISWWLATLFLPHFFPYLAPLAAVLVSNATAAESLEKAKNRISGVIGGVMLSILIAHWIPVSGVAVFLSVLIGLALATLLKLNQEIANQIGVSVIMVLAFINSPGYEWARILETIFGSIIAIFINVILIPPKTLSSKIKKMHRMKRKKRSLITDAPHG